MPDTRDPTVTADPPPPRQRLRTVVARTATTASAVTCVPLVVIGVATATGVLSRLPDPLPDVVAGLALPLVVAFVASLLALRLPRPVPPPPLALRCPVAGRWRAMNSPASKVPSHGTHAFGQTYAIDLVHEPADHERPPFGGPRATRDPREYPAFGVPVTAPVSGTVVAAHDGRRDHRSRSNLLGYLSMVVESVVFSLRGAAGVMGNHVVVEAADDDGFVAIAHLQRGSLTVDVGDHVEVGQLLGRVGNSGNSSEPHVHLHVMDRAAPGRALGQPFTFTDVVVDDAPTVPDAAPGGPVVPATDEVFHALGR